MNEADAAYVATANAYFSRLCIAARSPEPKNDGEPVPIPAARRISSISQVPQIPQPANDSDDHVNFHNDSIASTCLTFNDSSIFLPQNHDMTQRSSDVSLWPDGDDSIPSFNPFRRRRMELAEREEQRRANSRTSESADRSLQSPIPPANLTAPAAFRQAETPNASFPAPLEIAELTADQSTWIEPIVAPQPRAPNPFIPAQPVRQMGVQRPLTRSLAPERPVSPLRPQVNLAMVEVDRIPTTTRTVPVTRNVSAPRASAFQPRPKTPPTPRVFELIQDLPDISMVNDTMMAPFEVRNPTPPPPQIVRIPPQSARPIVQIGSSTPPEHSPPDIDFTGLTSEKIRSMSVVEQKDICDAMWESDPSVKYREHYPFYAEGVVSKDSDFPNQLRVYSSRMGKIYIKDSQNRKNNDYVYFLVLSEQEFVACDYAVHPSTLISAKFPDNEKIVIRGYALLAHPRGRNKSEGQWVCWNDQLGMMKIASGAARISLKKMPDWEKQLDIVSIHANFENNRYVVTTLCALTNIVEKRNHLPDEAFLVQDAVLVEESNEDFIFYSKKLDLRVFVKPPLTEGVLVAYETSYQIVAAPTFPLSCRRVFRGMFIAAGEFFWPKENEYVKDKLMEKTKIYERDAAARKTS